MAETIQNGVQDEQATANEQEDGASAVEEQAAGNPGPQPDPVVRRLLIETDGTAYSARLLNPITTQELHTILSGLLRTVTQQIQQANARAMTPAPHEPEPETTPEEENDG